MSCAPMIECQSVWKFFGDVPPATLKTIHAESFDKAQALERYKVVLAVANVSFAVNRGEIFCIMGLSGSGKSTLLRHVNRLIKPTSGRILVFGEDIGCKSGADLRRLRSGKIGMVFQHMALFPHRTVLENVSYGLEVRGVRKRQRRNVAREKLAMVQLEGWENYRPSELSGGMQQRVGLARALAVEPEILLMDEPFSALDPLIRRRLQDQFLEIAAVTNKTTLFITHDLDEAMRLGNRVAIMKDGRLSQIGTPQDIVTQPADNYVAEFVRDISRLRVLYARNVMKPLIEIEGKLSDAAPQVHQDARLSELIDKLLHHDHVVNVINNEGQTIGTAGMREVLNALREVPAKGA